MIYYQFMLRVKGSLPVTMKRKYRKEHRALEALRIYQKNGVSGCMVTLFVNSDKDYGTKEVREF